MSEAACCPKDPPVSASIMMFSPWRSPSPRMWPIWGVIGGGMGVGGLCSIRRMIADVKKHQNNRKPAPPQLPTQRTMLHAAAVRVNPSRAASHAPGSGNRASSHLWRRGGSVARTLPSSSALRGPLFFWGGGREVHGKNLSWQSDLSFTPRGCTQPAHNWEPQPQPNHDAARPPVCTHPASCRTSS
jgi:hypothetical protein